jgi:hypothetical protein
MAGFFYVWRKVIMYTLGAKFENRNCGWKRFDLNFPVGKFIGKFIEVQDIYNLTVNYKADRKRKNGELLLVVVTR